MQTDDDALEAMETYGGSFVQALAAAFRAGDPINRAKLLKAFPEYFEEYRALAAQRRSTPQC